MDEHELLKRLVAEVVKHRDEAAQLAEEMAQQGDMPNEVAFQNGVWNMAQRVIRMLTEAPDTLPDIE